MAVYGVSTVPQHVNRAAITDIRDDTRNKHAEETKELPKGKMQQLLTGIHNSSCYVFHSVKSVFVSMGTVFKKMATAFGCGASNPSRVSTKSTSADDATAQYNAALLKLASDPRAGTVTAKSILSPLLNNEKSCGGDERLIFDYLIKNPSSHLFSSDNIYCQGDSIYFKKPISLVRQGDAILFITNPMEGRAISRIKIDMRDGSNGGFCGKTVMKILQDETLTFNSLDDLCQKMTANSQRNISAMQTGNLHAAAFNTNKEEAAWLLYGQDRDSVSKFDYDALANPTEADRENSHSHANVVPDNAPISVSGNRLSAMRRTVSPGPRHVQEMVKRFDVQARISDDTVVQHDVRTYKQELSPAIKALQEKLAANFNQEKPLGGGIRQQ